MSILNPKVVVVIPTLNAGAPLNACLAALRAQTFREFETIVVDNGGKVSEASDDAVRVLRPGRNVGFGAAINLGARQSKAVLVVSLNDDAVPEPAWLAELTAAASANMMCASCILLDEARLDSAGLLLCGDGSTKQRGHGESPSRYARQEPALMPSGAAGLYPRVLFDELGGFDESFFLYCEDSDLGLRARWHGIGCTYVPTARVHHGYSLSAGRVSPLKAYLVERNRLALAIRCLPWPMLWKAPWVAVARYGWHLRLPGGAASEFRKESSALRLAWFVVKAHLAALANLPRLFRERAQVQRGRNVAAFLSIARQFTISAREVASQ